MAALHNHEEEPELDIEEGMLWLPSHVLDEACDVTQSFVRRRQKIQQQHQQQRRRQLPRYLRTPTETETHSQSPLQYPKCSLRSYNQRAKVTDGGHGMQAIFLESRQGSCGTGVFLPQVAGTNLKPSKKPACAPVLLPARVVQALNLNVQELGLQISPGQGSKYNPRCRKASNNNSTIKKNDRKDASKQYCGVISQNQNSSPEIFLPKEWTY